MVLNTKDYGIPQNRKRLFIIGSDKPLKSLQKVPMPPIDEYIDYSDTNYEEYCQTYKDREYIFKDATFAVVPLLRKGIKSKVCPDYAPTLVASCPLWNVKMHRKANIKECLRLQGFPEGFKQVVSDHQMRRQLGNSISVCVLEAIFKSYFN